MIGAPTCNTDKQPSKENFKYVISLTNYKLTVTRYGEDWLDATQMKEATQMKAVLPSVQLRMAFYTFD